MNKGIRLDHQRIQKMLLISVSFFVAKNRRFTEYKLPNRWDLVDYFQKNYRYDGGYKNEKVKDYYSNNTYSC
jgi:hypothetical protein